MTLEFFQSFQHFGFTKFKNKNPKFLHFGKFYILNSTFWFFFHISTKKNLTFRHFGIRHFSFFHISTNKKSDFSTFCHSSFCPRTTIKTQPWLFLRRTRTRVLGLLTTRANLAGTQLDVAFGILFGAVGFVDVGKADFQLDGTLHDFPVVLRFDCKFSADSLELIADFRDDLHKSVFPQPVTVCGDPGDNPFLNSFVGKQMGCTKSEYWTVLLSFRMAKS